MTGRGWDLSRYRFRCSLCGKDTRQGRLPRAGWDKKGDGTFRYPRRHHADGQRCKGSFMEALWIDATTGAIVD